MTEHATAPFSVISTKTQGEAGTLYKLFSKEPLANATLSSFFRQWRRVGERSWKAYPQYDPPELFAPFKLAPGLFYGNAWESAASAMEMSAIAAKNSALLVRQHLQALGLKGPALVRPAPGPDKEL